MRTALGLVRAAPVFSKFDSVVGDELDEDAQAERYDTPTAENPFGVVGIGRAGDGFTGSTVGRFVSTDTEASTADPLENDHDTFCSDLAKLSDGDIRVTDGSELYATSVAVPVDQDGQIVRSVAGGQ